MQVYRHKHAESFDCACAIKDKCELITIFEVYQRAYFTSHKVVNTFTMLMAYSSSSMLQYVTLQQVSSINQN